MVEIQSETKPLSLQTPTVEPVTFDGVLHRITGYYCQQIPGYPVGDGGGYCGITRLGVSVSLGIAACGSNFQLSSEIEVEGVGKLLCDDTGILAEDQVDIYYPTNQDLALSQKPDWARVRVIK